jgi:glutathione S-transferase
MKTILLSALLPLAAFTAFAAEERPQDRWRLEDIYPTEAAWNADAAKVEAQLADGREWLFGDFGLADLETFAWLAGMPGLVPEAFADTPRTNGWLERVRARPSVAQALALGTGACTWAPGPEINRWG